MVIKLASLNGEPCVKISDELTKVRFVICLMDLLDILYIDLEKSLQASSSTEDKYQKIVVKETESDDLNNGFQK